MDTLTICIPSEPLTYEPFASLAPTPMACACMSCATGTPGNRRSFGNARCLTHTYAIDKLISSNEPLFIKEQLGKYAEQSPFITMTKPKSEKQADCDCISCFIGEKCLIWDYEPGELVFTKAQLGQYYRHTPLYEGHEDNKELQQQYRSIPIQ